MIQVNYICKVISGFLIAGISIYMSSTSLVYGQIIETNCDSLIQRNGFIIETRDIFELTNNTEYDYQTKSEWIEYIFIPFDFKKHSSLSELNTSIMTLDQLNDSSVILSNSNAEYIYKEYCNSDTDINPIVKLNFAFGNTPFYLIEINGVQKAARFWGVSALLQDVLFENSNATHRQYTGKSNYSISNGSSEINAFLIREIIKVYDPENYINSIEFRTIKLKHGMLEIIKVE